MRGEVGLFFARLFHDGVQSHGYTAIFPALLRGLHEGEYFQGLGRLYGGLACAEECGDLQGEGAVTFPGADLCVAFLSEGGAAEVIVAIAEASEGADAVILPDAYYEVGSFCIEAGDGLAAGAHHGVEGLYRMDAVPKQVGMCLFQRGWSVSVCAQDLADLSGSDLLGVGHKT